MKIKYESEVDIDYIRKNIKLIRESKNLSQKEVAKSLAIATNSYQKFENGDIVLNMIRLHQIAEVFGISVVDIINYPNIVVAGADSERVKELEDRIREIRSENYSIKITLADIDNDFRLIRAFFEELPLQGYDMDKAYFHALERQRKGFESINDLENTALMQWKYKLSMVEYMNIIISQYEKLIAVIRY